MHWMQRIHRPTARKQVVEEGYRLRSGDIAYRKRRSVQRAICVGLRCASLERFSPWDSEIPGDADSPLEGDGFEPSVPLVNASAPCCRRECRSDRTGKSRDRSIPHERARNPFTSPVCPSASEIAARSPRMRAARDGVATAPGLSRQRASGQCDVGTVRAAGQPATFASLR
jgi:hypothetical protein